MSKIEKNEKGGQIMKELFISLFWWFIVILIIAIVGTFIALEVIVWIRYGSSPAGEVPTWALWLMMR